MEVVKLEPAVEKALIQELAERVTALEMEVLEKYGLTLIQGILFLKSIALASSTKFAVVCGLTKEQAIEETALVYDSVLKEFNLMAAQETEKLSEGAIPSP